MEVTYLLIFGQLPNKQQLQTFRDKVRKHANLNESMKHHFQASRRTRRRWRSCRR
jgi:citrate synthase